MCQGKPAGFRYILLSSVAETVWKDLGQVQRKSTLASKALVFFPECACKNEAQHAARRSSHHVSVQRMDLAKGKAPPCPAVCPARTQGLWPTECYKRTEEVKRDAETQVLSPALPIPYWVALGLLLYLSEVFFLLVKMGLVSQASSPGHLTGQSCICVSQVLSSWTLCLHTWFLRLLSTSGLLSLVLFPLYPG